MAAPPPFARARRAFWLAAITRAAECGFATATHHGQRTRRHNKDKGPGYSQAGQLILGHRNQHATKGTARTRIGSAPPALDGPDKLISPAMPPRCSVTPIT